MESERNRPPEFQNEDVDRPLTPAEEASLKRMMQAVETGISPEAVADQTFEAIRDEKFYILTHPEYVPIMRAAYDNRIAGLNPPMSSIKSKVMLFQLGLIAESGFTCLRAVGLNRLPDPGDPCGETESI